jgi:nucleotide-binding universal stress UspA family protein
LQIANEARKVIDADVKHLPEEISVITQIRHGYSGPQIVAAVEERDAELIVIGSPGRWWFARGCLETSAPTFTFTAAFRRWRSTNLLSGSGTTW